MIVTFLTRAIAFCQPEKYGIIETSIVSPACGYTVTEA
jgi:hypothetical protein